MTRIVRLLKNGKQALCPANDTQEGVPMVKAKMMHLTGGLLMLLLFIRSGESMASMQLVNSPFDARELHMQQEQQQLARSICVENGKHRAWLDLQLQIDTLRSQAVTPGSQERNAQLLSNLVKKQQDVMNRNSWPGC